MIAVLSMEEALERANWLLGKKMVLHFGSLCRFTQETSGSKNNNRKANFFIMLYG